VIIDTSTILDRFESQLQLLCGWDTEDESRGRQFAMGPLMTEADLQRIEGENGVTLPGEHREFLKRFGDGDVGPGNEFVPLSRALTANGRLAFALAGPFLGDCSPGARRLSEAERWEALGPVIKEWEAIPKDHGTLRICEYGCGISAVLILNGSYCGKIWILSGDAAYFGPFGGGEPLHNEEVDDSQLTDHPKEYTFLEWYGHWLDSQVGGANLAHD
jgi:hypothetical protein